MKKMQAMKVEKDNANDDSDTWEVKARNANTRRAKLEEELDDLIKKSQQLESDCDRAREELTQMEEKLEQNSRHESGDEIQVKKIRPRG